MEPGTAARPGPTSSCGLKAVAGTAGRPINIASFKHIIIHAMARYHQKRKRSGGRPYASKKRKTSFKRRARRGLRMSDQTSLNTKGTSNGFIGRKTSRSTYLKHLWNSSLFAQHWRSAFSTSGAITTPATTTTATFQATQLMKTAGTIPFYTAAGGLVPDDLGVALPTFKGDLTLRGGRWNFMIHNSTAAGVDVRVRTWLVFTNANPDFSYEPSGTLPLLWEPSLQPDWNEKIGKVIMSREVLLESGNNWSMSGKFKLQKIDQEQYAGHGKVLLLILNVMNIGIATSHSLQFTTSYNLSFSGDAIT